MNTEPAAPNEQAVNWNNQGKVYGRFKQYADALSCFDHAIAIQPDYLSACYNRVVCLNHLGRYAEVLEGLRHCSEIAPSDPDIPMLLENVLIRKQMEANGTQVPKRILFGLSIERVVGAALTLFLLFLPPYRAGLYGPLQYAPLVLPPYRGRIDVATLLIEIAVVWIAVALTAYIRSARKAA